MGLVSSNWTELDSIENKKEENVLEMASSVWMLYRTVLLFLLSLKEYPLWGAVKCMRIRIWWPGSIRYSTWGGFNVGNKMYLPENILCYMGFWFSRMIWQYTEIGASRCVAIAIYCGITIQISFTLLALLCSLSLCWASPCSSPLLCSKFILSVTQFLYSFGLSYICTYHMLAQLIQQTIHILKLTQG